MKQIPWNKGLKMSPQMREKMRLLKQGNTARLGKRHTLATKELISRNRTGLLTGASHPRWKGGRYATSTRHNATRRARERTGGGYHTLGEWELLKKQYSYTCPACKKCEPHVTLTRDHIIPISRGGSNFIENIQPLCKRCNSKKHTRTIKY